MTFTTTIACRAGMLHVSLGGTRAALLDATSQERAVAAHVGAAILARLPGRSAEPARLAILAHLADRIHMREWCQPLVSCRWHMTADGPTTSVLHALAHGHGPSGEWDAVVRRGGWLLRPAPGIDVHTLGELSPAMTGSIDATAAAFGGMDHGALSALVRQRLPECRDMRPRPLPPELVLAACGVPGAKEVVSTDEYFRWSQRLFARAMIANDRATDKAI